MSHWVSQLKIIIKFDFNNLFLVVEYNIMGGEEESPTNIGYIRYYLAPKIDEGDE